MKNYVLEMTGYNGRTLYATTDYLATVTEDINRAKRFTLNKATKLISNPKGKGFRVIEIK